LIDVVKVSQAGGRGMRVRFEAEQRYVHRCGGERNVRVLYR